MTKIIIFIFLYHILNTCLCVNVVIFQPGTTDDEKRLVNRLAQDLAFRNHHVCVFRAIVIPEMKFLIQPRLQDVRELRLNANLSRSIHERISDRGNDRTIWDIRYDASDKHMIPVWNANAHACESILDSDLMDRLRDELYDVAVVYAGNPCYLGIVHALAMPFIYYDMQGLTDEIIMASSSPWIPSLPFSIRSLDYKNFTFSSRLNQFWAYLQEYSLFTNLVPAFLMPNLSLRWSVVDKNTSQLFQVNKELKKLFATFPNVEEIKRSAAAYFVNSDSLIELNGRPAVPNLVYVGGMHIEFARPMFPPYNETNALAKDGVIIMSMGTVANCTKMPKRMKRAFLKAFSRLANYRIYWRLGSATLGDDFNETDIPKNINFTQFIPQNDLLATDETVLFISNGGANSVMEALNYGVPVLGIPLYGVNYDNLKKLESKGAAIIVQKHEINAQTIYEAMRKLLKDEKMVQRLLNVTSRSVKEIHQSIETSIDQDDQKTDQASPKRESNGNRKKSKAKE